MREIKLRQIKYLKENEVRQQILVTSALSGGRRCHERAATFKWDIILRKHYTEGLDISQWLSACLACMWLLLWGLVPGAEKRYDSRETYSLTTHEELAASRLSQVLGAFIRAKLGESQGFWLSWAQGEEVRLSPIPLVLLRKYWLFPKVPQL